MVAFHLEPLCNSALDSRMSVSGFLLVSFSFDFFQPWKKFFRMKTTKCPFERSKLVSFSFPTSRHINCLKTKINEKFRNSEMYFNRNFFRYSKRPCRFEKIYWMTWNELWIRNISFRYSGFISTCIKTIKTFWQDIFLVPESNSEWITQHSLEIWNERVCE